MKKVKLVEDDYPLVKKREHEKRMPTVKFIRYGIISGSSGDVIVVLLKRKKYTRKMQWKDLGNSEGYPYVVIQGKEYGLEED